VLPGNIYINKKTAPDAEGAPEKGRRNNSDTSGFDISCILPYILHISLIPI